jgi:hypothetical protein
MKFQKGAGAGTGLAGKPVDAAAGAGKTGGSPAAAGTTAGGKAPAAGKPAGTPPPPPAPAPRLVNLTQRPALWASGQPVAFSAGSARLPEPAPLDEALRREAQAAAGPEHAAGDLRWRFEPSKGRWLYQQKGESLWWLPALDSGQPSQVMLDGRFYSYSPVAGGARLTPEADLRSGAGAGELFFDASGAMLVSVAGPRRCAELYTNAQPPVFVSRLSADVQSVSFVDGPVAVLSAAGGARAYDVSGRPAAQP